MARKAKKRLHQMPPLSFVDKLTYLSIFILLCATYVVLLFGPLYFRHKIAFSDTAVIAADANASLWWLIVPFMTFFLMTFILWLQFYQKRIPIFGRRNFKYGPPTWPKVYPLFMKNKPPVWVSERKKKERKKIAVILLVVLLGSFIPLPWSLYGRDCLYYDGSIIQYNMFNRPTDEFSSGDITDIEIGTFHYSNGRYHTSLHFGVRLVFKTDSGRKYIFEHRDFQNDASSETRYWFEWMLTVKKLYDPGIIHYDGLENLDRVIADRNLSQEGVQMLYQLFDQYN